MSEEDDYEQLSDAEKKELDRLVEKYRPIAQPSLDALEKAAVDHPELLRKEEQEED